MINFGFKQKRASDKRLPPGQYETRDFPVLSKGPTPIVPTQEWKLKTWGLCDEMTWDWDKFNKLPMTDWVKDIHCVTTWSKFDTLWKGVLFDEIIKLVSPEEIASHIMAHSSDGYTTNLPIEDLIDGKAMIAVEYDSEPIEASHGGPVRLIVPHLYFWKSAKWLSGIEFIDHDEAGFWETYGYHNYGDPWKEQRYDGD